MALSFVATAASLTACILSSLLCSYSGIFTSLSLFLTPCYYSKALSFPLCFASRNRPQPAAVPKSDAAKIGRKNRTAKRFGDIFVKYRQIPSEKKLPAYPAYLPKYDMQIGRIGRLKSTYHISSSSRLPQRYLSVSWAATPLSSSRATRLGMAMRAFMQSAMFQMMSRLMMLPKKRATMYRMR